MERKFKSKLVTVKASEVRKQAIVQLKESIELNKFRQVEPIDYDAYIEKNNATIRKDACSKHLILLPVDDLTAEHTPTHDQGTKAIDSKNNSLFVSDCLKTYAEQNFEVKYKYHKYGGNFRQLPDYNHRPSEKLSELLYEVDVSEKSNVTNVVRDGLTPQARTNFQEKHGWLNYRIIGNVGDKHLKKRYFHLRRIDSPISSRNHAVEPRYQKINSEIQESNQMYILEYFKEVPGTKRNEMPKNHIMFDSNINSINKTNNKHGPLSFEITETDLTNNQTLQHLFIAENQTKCNEWYNLLRSVILQVGISSSLSQKKHGASFSCAPFKHTDLDPLINDKINTGNYSIPNSPTSSTSSGTAYMAANASSAADTNATRLLDNFDLNKYLNENEEDLLGNQTASATANPPEMTCLGLLNPFDLYPAKLESGDLFEEETELQCNWPEPEIGRKLLIDFEHFKLNLNLPLCVPAITSKSSLFKENNHAPVLPRTSSSIPLAINPELFYLTFALFDVRNQQKISENFYCIPNYDIFVSQLTKNKGATKLPRPKSSSLDFENSVQNIQKSVFSLDGKNFMSNQEILRNASLLKRNNVNNLRRAMFKVVDVHEEIYIVARIEKCLDGASLHSAVQPYLTQIQNENSRIKNAIKLHKKTQQIIKTKLANYRQPFAWAARPIYRRVTNMKSDGHIGAGFELDKSQKFCVFEQDVHNMSDESLLGYLKDLHYSIEKNNLNKLVEIPNADLMVYFNDIVTPEMCQRFRASNLIDPFYTLPNSLNHSFSKYDSIIRIDHFEPILGNINTVSPFISHQQSSSPNRTNQSTIALVKNNTEKDSIANTSGSIQTPPAAFTNADTARSTDRVQMLKKAQIIETNKEFKSFMYVYPKMLKYDQQRVFSKARNILIKTEFKETDSFSDENKSNLHCVFDINKSLAQNTENTNLLTSTYYTPITHHNKNPEFYDEIKILLPLNLTEHHHLLFKFYHVSCSSARSVTITSPSKSTNNTNLSNVDIESLIGYAWMSVFKNGRLISGEKTLPVAQVLADNYLSAENDIKWVENMKPLFKINLAFQTSVHTTDPHVANFFLQCEKLMLTLNSQSIEEDENTVELVRKRLANMSLKRKAPVAVAPPPPPQAEITIVLNDPNKEIMNNSLKALHAADLSTIIKYFPTLLTRILSILVTAQNNDSSIHAVRAILHFVWQMTYLGKIAYLKAFIKYIFHIDYTPQLKQAASSTTFPTIHHELISNLVVLLRQLIPLQDFNQMNLIFKNCWFFLEVALKSVCLYACQHAQQVPDMKPSFDEDFYNSLQVFYELLIESIVRHAPTMGSVFAKDPDFCDSFRSCNRSLAMFIKKSLNILNKKFLFILINKYLESLQSHDKQLYELKFDFIRIICNHEHYIAFNLPVRKCLTNINEFTELKHEFCLSPQFRQTHYLVGVLLGAIVCPSMHEAREQRRNAICMLRNILCKHSYDDRYVHDKVKQARIAALYLPLIEILIDNIGRLDLGAHPLGATHTQLSSQQSNSNRNSTHCYESESQTASLNRQVSLTTGGNSLPSSIVHNPSVYTTAVLNNFVSGSGSGSIYNGHIQNENNQLKPGEACSVLGAIAGLGNTNPENLITPSLISDTDSLSSIDDSQFKGSLRSKNRMSVLFNGFNNLTVPAGCNSSTTNSDIGTLNNSSSINVSVINETNKSYVGQRRDKLESGEVKDLLISVVYILKNLGHDSLLGLLLNYEENEFVDFLTLVELCLKTFRYRGKANLHTLNAISKGVGFIKSPRATAVTRHTSDLAKKKSEPSETAMNEELALEQQILIESNLCHQVGLVIMNILSLILIHHKEKLCENHGDNSITKRLIDIYFYTLESNQSIEIKLRTFASLRVIINKASRIFLSGNSVLCANLCLKLLKCFNSQYQSVRVEACIVLYLLMRKNYEFTKQKSIGRVHSQTIISTSQLIGTMQLSNNSQVLECLTVLNNLAFDDKSFQATRFALEVQDLTKRIKNILQATSQMKNYQDDTEMLIDSQYSLAKSYGNSVELRRIWLDSMASIHVKEKNYSEAAHCYLHIAALMSQNLKHQGQYTLGCSVFKKITPNIELEEELGDHNGSSEYGSTTSDTSNSNDTFDLNQVKYTQTQLLDYLCKSADMLKLGERYDNLPAIFKLAVAIYETNRDYEHLQKMHQNIQRAYSHMAERDQQAHEKPLGAYYRVCFYGHHFNEENNKVYIYKEPSNTKLFEITDRLKKVYTKQFGSLDSVEILRDSRKPHELKLDTTNKNYIQIIHVQAYFSKQELSERVSFFERNNNLKKFYYETPYQLELGQNNSSCQHSELLRLCKRKIVLETSHWFPYVKKRILVIYEKTIDLNPLETAIDELEQKIEAFESILRKKDLTLLELYLQGAIIPQVHKGPLAYAEAFLEPNEQNFGYSKELKQEFKNVFKHLIELYQKGIEQYGQLAAKCNSADEKGHKSLSMNGGTLSSTKYMEMHCLLQTKFLEFENSFRNLLLVDGDLDGYQKQLHKETKLSIDLVKQSSSHA